MQLQSSWVLFFCLTPYNLGEVWGGGGGREGGGGGGGREGGEGGGGKGGGGGGEGAGADPRILEGGDSCGNFLQGGGGVQPLTRTRKSSPKGGGEGGDHLDPSHMDLPLERWGKWRGGNRELWLPFATVSVTQGMFKVQVWFFVALFAHIMALQVLAWWVLWYFGNNWITWLVSAVLLTTGQAQAGWLQHDFGHHTVFNNTKLNHFFHDITIGLMKVG